MYANRCMNYEQLTKGNKHLQKVLLTKVRVPRKCWSVGVSGSFLTPNFGNPEMPLFLTFKFWDDSTKNPP